MANKQADDAMELLFAAKINVPKATELMGHGSTEQNWEATKRAFREYCELHPAEYAPREDRTRLRRIMSPLHSPDC